MAEKMRTTMHNGRGKFGGGTAFGTVHNDRNFDISKAENIDPERQHLNEFWHLGQNEEKEGEELTFDAAELKFYEENFSHQLEAVNEKYRKSGHKNRCKTMDEWRQIKQYAPEESILQIGKMEAHVDHEKLMDCYADYDKWIEEWNAGHGKPFTKLNHALHADEEGAPHVQQRRVWHYKGEDGLLYLGQEKALEAAGVSLPDPEKDPSRRNNRKMTFDRMCREKWLDILHEHGLDIEREPVPHGRHNREKEKMIRDKYEDLLAENDRLKAENKDLEMEAQEARQDAQEARSELQKLTAPKEIQAVTPKKSFGRASLPASEMATVLEYARNAAVAVEAQKEAQETAQKAQKALEREKSDNQKLEKENRKLRDENWEWSVGIRGGDRVRDLQARIKTLEEQIQQFQNFIRKFNLLEQFQSWLETQQQRRTQRKDGPKL